jgi:hypothetical protein
LLVDGKLKSISHSEFEDRTGLELCDKDGVLKEELPPIQRWLNRILALPIGLQNSIFDEFLSLVETRVSAARRLAGSMSVSRRSSVRHLDRRHTARTDPVSGATSHLLTIEIARRRTRSWSASCGSPTAMHRRLLINAKSGMVALQTRARSLMEEKEGTPIPRVEMMRPTRNEYMREHDLFDPPGRR